MNPIDYIVSFANPERGLQRIRARAAIKAIRGYDAAKTSRLSRFGRMFSSKKAADEVSTAHERIAKNSHELVRNSPLAKRIKMVLAGNIVGSGIHPEFSGTNKAKLKKYKRDYNAWANSTACDHEGHNTLYGLQYLWTSTIIESGGVIVKKNIVALMKFPLQLQTLEQQYLDSSKQDARKKGNNVVDGIEFAANGKVEGYWLLEDVKAYQGENGSVFVPVEDIAFAFFKERAGQHLGVSWFAPITKSLDERNGLKEAMLMQQRIAASFGVIIKGASKTMGLEGKDTGKLKDADGLEYDSLEAGMIGYTDGNTDVATVSPPKADNGKGFHESIDRDIAVGMGMTYEQLTGNYGNVTWASGRLARGEFYTNLDVWQLFMMVPALNKIMDWYDELYGIKFGGSSVERSWVLPHRSAVNPVEEIDVDIRKVRTAAMTPQEFSRKHGGNFEDIIAAWKEAKIIMESADLPFDHDPSKFSNAGNQLNEDDAASSNAASKEENKKSKEDD